MTATVADVMAVLERAYPPRLAESWDTGIGLTCGDPAAEVRAVLLAVDADLASVTQAMEVDAQLLVTHHPVLFRPVQSVAADTAKGALIHRMITAGIAHFAAHTNADKAAGGVNDALATALGLLDVVPLNCGPVSAANDPEEESNGVGSGRIGRLAAPLSLHEFARLVAGRLPGTVTGVRAAGDPHRTIIRVAVCGGAGSSLLDDVAAAGADVFVTSDLSHHVAAEFVADPARPALVDVAHWAGEWPFLAGAAEVIDQGLAGTVAVTVSSLRTDPWTLHYPAVGKSG